MTAASTALSRLLAVASLARAAVAPHEILFVVMSTTNTLKNPFFNWESRALPAHRTWARGARLLFVMEYNELSRERFARPGCRAHRTRDRAFALVKCAGEPPVVLTKQCGGEYPLSLSFSHRARRDATARARAHATAPLFSPRRPSRRARRSSRAADERRGAAAPERPAPRS